MATTNTLRTEKLTPTVGAEVLDVDVERLRKDEDLPAAVMEAVEANGILVFPALHIDDETQVSFCKKLGDVAVFPDEPNPEIIVVSLDPEYPYAPYLKAGENWHMDDLPEAIPTKATMLSAKVLADEGGETEFASTFAAYDDLSDDEKERFADLVVVHSHVPMQLRSHPNATEEQIAEWRGGRSQEHPLVWRHRNGRRSLILGTTAEYVVGMDPDESRALLANLNERATRAERVYRHVWSEGDTVMWNNLGVLHRRLPYDLSSHRRMHRTALFGLI